MARRQFSRLRHLGLGAGALVCGIALACSGKSVRQNEDGDDAGEGGTQTSGAAGNVARGGASGTTAGGTESTGGASSTTTGGAAGTAAGGASGARGGSSGSATGGTSTGGSSGAGACPTCMPATCTTTIIPTNTINDFDNLYFAEDTEPPLGIFGILDEQGMLKPDWWLGYYSGSYVYPMIPQACSGQPAPMYPLVYDEMGGVLRVTGTVGGPSGFGIWLGPCIIDMSGSLGVSFTIGGRTGSGGLEMKVNTSSTTDPDASQIGRGKCATDMCAPPSVTFPVPGTVATFALPWTAFNGGSPAPTVDLAEVVQLRWDFEWVDGMTPYTVDVTLDNVMLFE